MLMPYMGLTPIRIDQFFTFSVQQLGFLLVYYHFEACDPTSQSSTNLQFIGFRVTSVLRIV